MRIVMVFVVSISFIVSAMAQGGWRPTFRELAEKARRLSPELQISRLEALAKISESQSSYSALLPELGIDVGVRSHREREKQNEVDPNSWTRKYGF